MNRYQSIVKRLIQAKMKRQKAIDIVAETFCLNVSEKKPTENNSLNNWSDISIL